MLTRLRRVLALIAVVAALLAITAMFKRETCGCSGGLPYTTIALWAGAGAALSLAAYFALSVRRG